MQVQHHQLYDPPLPAEKVAAINALGVGIVNKLYVHFSGPAQGSETQQHTGLRLEQAVRTPVTSFAKVSKHMSSDRASPLKASGGTNRNGEAALPDSKAHDVSISAAPIDQLDTATELPQADASNSQAGHRNRSTPDTAGQKQPASSPGHAQDAGSGGSSGKPLQPVVSYHLLWRDRNQYANASPCHEASNGRNGMDGRNGHDDVNLSQPTQAKAEQFSAESKAAGLPSWAKGLCNLRFGGSEFIREAAATAPSASLVSGRLFWYLS